MELSREHYIEMCRDFKMDLRRMPLNPFPPEYYCKVYSKYDGEEIALLWWYQGGERWVALSPPEIPEEVEELFRRERAR